MSRPSDPFRRRQMCEIPNQVGFKIWAFTKQTGAAVEATVIRNGDGIHRLDAGSTSLFSGWRPREDQDDHRRKNHINISVCAPLLTAFEIMSRMKL